VNREAIRSTASPGACAGVAGLGLTTVAAAAAAVWARRMLDLGEHSLLLLVPVAAVAALIVFAAACGLGALALDTRDRRRRARG
jgi:ABC-type Na+ efflux pump permease subunit